MKVESLSPPGFRPRCPVYRGEKGGLTPQEEDIDYFVDNSSSYTYLDRGFEILITPPLTPKLDVMKLFLDTAIVSDIEDRFNTSLISGITTNPTLIKKTKRNPWDVYKDIIELGVDDLSIEVNGDDSQELVRNAMTAHGNYGNVATIKLPCTIEGLKACKYLSNIGIRVNMTLVFSVSQALLCGLAGATYVSPFIGRMDDNSLDGMKLINDISNVFKKQFINTLILAASVRDAQSVGVAFGLGADICTVPPKVFDDMAKHVLTDKGLEQFKKDSEG